MKGEKMYTGLYVITPSELEEIVQYAVDHPEKHFAADELSDEEGDFLSCGFIHNDPMKFNESPIWELNGVEEEDK